MENSNKPKDKQNLEMMNLNEFQKYTIKENIKKNQKEIFLKDFENFLEKNCGRVSQFKVTEQTKKYCLTSEEIEKVSTGLSYFFLGEEEKIFYLFQIDSIFF